MTEYAEISLRANSKSPGLFFAAFILASNSACLSSSAFSDCNEEIWDFCLLMAWLACSAYRLRSFSSKRYARCRRRSSASAARATFEPMRWKAGRCQALNRQESPFLEETHQLHPFHPHPRSVHRPQQCAPNLCFPSRTIPGSFLVLPPCHLYFFAAPFSVTMARRPARKLFLWRGKRGLLAGLAFLVGWCRV